MGCLWAFHSTDGRRDITLILRDSKRLAQFKRSGGISAIVDGKPVLHPCKGLLAEQIDAPIEQLLICCKAHQTCAAFASVAAALAPQSTVLLLQNGMGVAEQLLSQRPDIRLFCGISTDGAHLVEHFTVQRAGYGTTRLGLFPRDPELQASQQLCRQLTLPELKLEPCDNIYLAQWQKLTVNAVINPLTAIFSIRNGELMNHPEAASLITPLCQEIARISQARDIALSASTIQDAVARICRQTANNISSMLQDIRQQRDCEIDYINGFLQRCAEEYGLPAPINRQLIERVTALENTFPGSGQNRP
jgi:2-dehydropantoate 2-reductase